MWRVEAMTLTVQHRSNHMKTCQSAILPTINLTLNDLGRSPTGQLITTRCSMITRMCTGI